MQISSPPYHVINRGLHDWYRELYASLMKMPEISASLVAPNNVVAGYPGDLVLVKLGGANVTLWVKESGLGTKTGWVAK